MVGLYWPSMKSLHDNVRPSNGPGGGGNGPTSLVTIYDRGLASDSTRWVPTVVGGTTTTPTLTVSQSEAYVQPLQTMTLTFGGTPTPGDAVGIVLRQIGGGTEAVVPVAAAADTATTMASKALALLQANPTIMGWLTASVNGNVLTLVSLQSGKLLSLDANVGNGGTRLIEIGRRKRHFQIVVWSRTPDDRITVGDPIEALIAQLEWNFGLTFADGTMGRVTYSGDIMHDEATLSDTMRRDWLLCVDYGINVSDMTYSILAPISQYTTF